MMPASPAMGSITTQAISSAGRYVSHISRSGRMKCSACSGSLKCPTPALCTSGYGMW